VTSARTMPSLLAVVAFSLVFTPILGGSLQPFFRKFLKLAKEEQELIKEQNQLLEKILQAQEMRSLSGAAVSESEFEIATLRSLPGEDYMSQDDAYNAPPEPECRDDSDCPKLLSCSRKRCIDPCPGTCAKCTVINHKPRCLDGKVEGAWSDWGEWGSCDSVTERKKRRRGCNNPPPQNGGAYCSGSISDEEYCTGKPREGWGERTVKEMANYDNGMMEGSDNNNNNNIPREWVDKYKARKGDGNSLYMTIPRDQPDGNSHYFNGQDLMAAAKASGEQNRRMNPTWETGWPQPLRWVGGGGDDNNGGPPTGAGFDYGVQMRGGESGDDDGDGIPREWVDKYGARQGAGNSLYMNIPRNHPDGNHHFFNMQELKDAARGK